MTLLAHLTSFDLPGYAIAFLAGAALGVGLWTRLVRKR